MFWFLWLPTGNLSYTDRHHLHTLTKRSDQMSISRILALRSLSSIRPVAHASVRLARSSMPAQTVVTVPMSPRFYATKGKSKSTANIVPGSKQKITDEAALKEYEKAENTMQTAVEWFRKECAGYETRASGRVTPAILSPVRVKLPDDPTEHPLEALATVGVREGTTLLITLFDEHNMKHVESALYTCNIPGVVPHKHDPRTVKVPIPKYVDPVIHSSFTAKKKAEEIRMQVRKQHTTSLKRGKFEKHSIEIEEFQKLTDKYVGEVDKVLKDLQKATGAK
ncbi:hypothetical protein EST38_g6895 [Candolleomyces aberdarensis]|uniref:Ribosome recycling factor domain-containing protein n=1 Tax=Candolleomyces aberdarensis TaxID=2316362 RepID=A0A4Q2DGI1_9AGAR|nr:hypothetical protein EST38_g6895 [Candolleomyces aberdarensis]